MKTKFTITLMCVIAILIIISFPSKNDNDIQKLRQQHATFLIEHPFNEQLQLSKEERKNLGFPPNKYFEEQYLLEMNPALGRPEFEKKLALQERLQERLKAEGLQLGVPGTGANAWVERGPSNVPGRTRAILFDPNDATNKRVFAGGVSGGLWVNNDITDSSSSWARVGIPENLAISSITVDPNNSMIMYLGTGESYVQGQVNGNGVYKSTNGGASWAKIFGLDQGTAFFNGGSKVTINSPVSIVGDLVAVLAAFGPVFSSAITGDLVLVDDGSGSPTEGCNTLINGASINGKIAVIERGSCNFTLKVKNAQNQGATAVLMINNVDGNPITMGGTDATITIPSVMISKTDGASILTTLQSQTVNATLGDEGNLPSGVTLVPGIFHVNDIVTRNNGGTTEIYVAIADAIFREAPGTLLGDGTEFGLYRSTNEGSTWTKINLPSTTNGNPFEPNDIEISSDNTIWLSTTSSSSFGDGGGTIFSSIDGTTFTQKHVVPNASRTEIEISATNPNKIYVLANENPLTMIKTTNGFTSTSTLVLPNDADNGIPANDFTRGQAFYDLMLEVDPTNDEIVYVGGIDMHRSIDGGTSWIQISKWSNNANLHTLSVPSVHADIHELSFDPSNPDKAVIATDGGVFYANSLASASSSTTAIFSSNINYNTTQFYKGAIGQNASVDQILGGAQDNGTNFINGGSIGINASTRVSGGDGGFCFIDKDGEYLITSFTNNNYTRFSLPSLSPSRVIDNDGTTGSFINPADLNDNLDILYTNGTSSTTFQVAEYKNIKSGTPSRRNLAHLVLLTSSPTALKVSPFTIGSTTLFVGTLGGKLIKIGGANLTFPNPTTWTDLTGAGFVGSISAINFGANEQEIIVTFHNYGVTNIWFTVDGGTTWQNKEGDFPDIPIKSVLMNPLLNDEVIIGTDLGVWRTANFKDASPVWKQSQNGMQNVKVTSLELRTADNTVLASTYGRGFFTSQFTSIPLGLNDNNFANNSIRVFPTINNGNFTVVAKSSLGATNMRIYSITGQEVFNSKFQLSTSRSNFNLSATSGIYFVNLKGDNFEGTQKIIIK